MKIIRALLALLGLAAMGYGLVLAPGALARSTDLAWAAGWFLLPPLISDLVIIPIAGVFGLSIARHASARWKAPLAAGMIITAAVLAVAWPFVGGFGRRPDNPSVLDRPYGWGVLILLAVIWAGVAIWGVLRRSGVRVDDGSR